MKVQRPVVPLKVKRSKHTADVPMNTPACSTRELAGGCCAWYPTEDIDMLSYSLCSLYVRSYKMICGSEPVGRRLVKGCQNRSGGRSSLMMFIITQSSSEVLYESIVILHLHHNTSQLTTHGQEIPQRIPMESHYPNINVK